MVKKAFFVSSGKKQNTLKLSKTLLKINKLNVLAGILGILVLGGVVFGAQSLDKKQAQPGFPPIPTVTCGLCPQLMPPKPDFCKNGTIVSEGRDECGCQMPPKCETARDKKFVCPEDEWLNCMPIIEGETAWFCSEEYLSWAKKNCPEFKIAY